MNLRTASSFLFLVIQFVCHYASEDKESRVVMCVVLQRSVEETLRLVQAFQYTDKHGEVCPANWTPGAKTIKPDTKAAQEYFVDAN